jgi:hypothetical protein
MSDETPTNPPDATKVRTDLHEVARLLRTTSHLDPRIQQELADLLDELSQTIHADTAAPPEVLHLAQSATQLARQLHQPHNRAPLEAARDRLQQTVARVETTLPGTVADLAHRFIELLTNLGI